MNRIKAKAKGNSKTSGSRLKACRDDKQNH